MNVHVVVIYAYAPTSKMSCSVTPSGIDARCSVSCWRRSASCPLNAESALSESMRGSCIFRQSGPNAHFPCTYCVRTSLSFLVPYLPSLSPPPLSFVTL